MYEKGTKKLKLHSRRNLQQLVFGEYYLPFGSESFFFPTHLLPQGAQNKIRETINLPVLLWVWNLVSLLPRKDKCSDRSRELVPKSAFGHVEKELGGRWRIWLVGSFMLCDLLSPDIVSMLKWTKMNKNTNRTSEAKPEEDRSTCRQRWRRRLCHKVIGSEEVD